MALGAYLDYVEEHLALYRFVRAHDSDVEAGAADGSAVRQVKDTVAGVANYGGSLDVIVDDAEER